MPKPLRLTRWVVLSLATAGAVCFADTVAFDTGPRTNFPRFALRVHGLDPFRAERTRALAAGDAERAWERALAAVRVASVDDGEGRTFAVAVDESASVAALCTPDDWGVPRSLAWWPAPRPGWSAPILLLREDAWAELAGSDAYAIGRAVRRSGDDLAWTLDDSEIDWRPFGEHAR
ncbi:MAG TPA: hypothetical protein VJP77_08780 [Planctomycetota bacterium]|nr:hypothetical protein [Planctomycetota bacterium]